MHLVKLGLTNPAIEAYCITTKLWSLDSFEYRIHTTFVVWATHRLFPQKKATAKLAVAFVKNSFIGLNYLRSMMESSRAGDVR
jgi:hypothetical protein